MLRTIFNDIESVKLYNCFSYQGNVLRKLIIFCKVMQHLVPRGDFPLDVEGGFASKAATSRAPVEEYSFFKSENEQTRVCKFFSKTFLDN